MSTAYHVIERSNTRQVNLCTLDAIPFYPVNLSSHCLVVVRRIDFDRVESFLRDGDDCTPTKFYCEIFLSFFVDTTPNGFQVDAI